MTIQWCGDSAEVNGFQLRRETLPDDAMQAPWVEHDGHGPVREARANYTGYITKRPGEVVIGGDRFGANARADGYDLHDIEPEA